MSIPRSSLTHSHPLFPTNQHTPTCKHTHTHTQTLHHAHTQVPQSCCWHSLHPQSPVRSPLRINNVNRMPHRAHTLLEWLLRQKPLSATSPCSRIACHAPGIFNVWTEPHVAFPCRNHNDRWSSRSREINAQKESIFEGLVILIMPNINSEWLKSRNAT